MIKRIKARKRDVETAITIDYLKEIKTAIQFRVDAISDETPVIPINSQENNFLENIDCLKSKNIF